MRYTDAIEAKRVDPPVETKADPFTLEGLIAWLETMPADLKYDRDYPGRCLAGQWIRTNDPSLMGAPLDKKSVEITAYAPFNAIALSFPCTFGAALERARIALSKR